MVAYSKGGLIGGDLFAGRAMAEKKIMEAYVMPPEMLDPKRGHVSIVLSMPQTSRRKPITDDMVQMCADLGIEPRLAFKDGMEQISKQITRLLFHSLKQSLKEDYPSHVARNFRC